MGNRWKAQHVQLKYTFIKAHRQECDTAMSAASSTCRAADSMPGYGTRSPIAHGRDQRLLGLIRAAYTASHSVYGAPRIFLDLREAGETCSKHRVARIIRANNLKTRYGY
ncbi:MAG: transposase [Nitrospira sp.]|nr:MAG: transposase [Nitrospira sp.]